MRIVVVMGRITTTMVFSSILFWQPTYTDLTVSSNGLMGFLMRRIVTTMVLGRIVTTLMVLKLLLICPLFTLLAFLPHFRIVLPCPQGLSIWSHHSEAAKPLSNGCAASCVSTSLCAATCGAPETKLQLAVPARATSSRRSRAERPREQRGRNINKNKMAAFRTKMAAVSHCLS